MDSKSTIREGKQEYRIVYCEHCGKPIAKYYSCLSPLNNYTRLKWTDDSAGVSNDDKELELCGYCGCMLFGKEW